MSNILKGLTITENSNKMDTKYDYKFWDELTPDEKMNSANLGQGVTVFNDKTKKYSTKFPVEKTQVVPLNLNDDDFYEIDLDNNTIIKQRGPQSYNLPFGERFLKLDNGNIVMRGMTMKIRGLDKVLTYKTTEDIDLEEQELDEDLRKWFKEKWVRFGPDGKIRGACARGDDSEGKPKCLPQSKAQSLGKKGRASAAARKRREDPNPERSGKAINVATKKKSNEGVAEGQALSTSALTGEIPTLMGLRKKEQGDLIEKYALYNREKDYFELFVELSGKPMSEIYNMNDSHQLANELYNLGSQIASDWRNISNPKFSRREYLNQIMSDWYNLFKKSIQKYKSMKQGVTEAINPDITNPAFSHQQQIGDYLYVARYWSKGLKISAYDGDKQIGYAELMYQTAPFDDFADPKTTPKRVWLESEWTKVNPKYQRQGIMSTMYAYAKMLGNSVKPSELRSPDAKAAWASWRQAGDAKHLTSNEGVAEGLNEMDKSAPQPGRDGKVSQSTYGSRDKKGSDYFKGKEAPGKAITAKQASKDALDILKKQGVAEGKMAELEMDLEDPEITDRQFEKMYGMTRKEAREQFSQTDMWAFPEIRDPNRPLHERGVAEGSFDDIEDTKQFKAAIALAKSQKAIRQAKDGKDAKYYADGTKVTPAEVARRAAERKAKKQDVAEEFGPLPKDNQQIRLGRHTVDIERVGLNKNYISFAWHDSKGQEHYEEVAVGDLGSYDDLIKKIKQEISYQERQYTDQGVAEGLNEGQYEMMMRNGQVKKFVAKDDADAKRIAKGHGAKSVIRLKGGIPAGKVSEQGVAEQELDEACWKGYHKEGMKTMFGKKYPNCVKNTNEEQEQHSEKCPHCGGEMVSEELMNEKKDACYYKVKSRYKVWPSAYASGALVQCRKKGASNWGTKSEGVAEGSDKYGFHTSVSKGKFLPSKYGQDENNLYLHDLMNVSGDGSGPQLVTIDDKRIATELAAMYGGYVERTGMGTYRVYQPRGARLTIKKPEQQGVAEEQLDEKWSQKYKDSINCSNPKGFSQKAHCAGKKKNESAILTGLKLHESK